MAPPIPIAVFGANGRMGRAILRKSARHGADVVGALVREGSECVDTVALPVAGNRTSPLEFTTDLSGDVAPRVLMEFAGAAGFDSALALALDRRIALVSGSTGLNEAQRAALAEAAFSIPVLASANFSIGIAVLTQLVADAARQLRDFDCEIVEIHHGGKRDAPSGTALALGSAIAHERGSDFSTHKSHARTGARKSGEIGFAVVRGGDVVGEHQVLFIGDGERIELIHRASDRGIFADGAIKAAIWLSGRHPGTHSLHDMLAEQP